MTGDIRWADVVTVVIPQLEPELENLQDNFVSDLTDKILELLTVNIATVTSQTFTTAEGAAVYIQGAQQGISESEFTAALERIILRYGTTMPVVWASGPGLVAGVPHINFELQRLEEGEHA